MTGEYSGQITYNESVMVNQGHITVTKWHSDGREATRNALCAYTNHFFLWHTDLVPVRMTVTILREMRAAEGLVGCHVRADYVPIDDIPKYVD